MCSSTFDYGRLILRQVFEIPAMMCSRTLEQAAETPKTQHMIQTARRRRPHACVFVEDVEEDVANHCVFVEDAEEDTKTIVFLWKTLKGRRSII